MKGFTLIELLIVVAIIGILAAIAIPNFLAAQTRAKVSRVMADQQAVATALELYKIDNSLYPAAAVVTGLNTGYSIYPRINRLKPLTTPISYLSTIPRDPFSRGQSPAESVFTYGDRKSYWESGWVNADPPPTGGMIVPQFITGNKQWFLLSKSITNLRTDISTLDQRDEYDPTNGTVSIGHIMRWGP